MGLGIHPKMKIWKIRDSTAGSVAPNEWEFHLEVPRILVDLLWQRGVRTLSEMKTFLAPGLRYLAPPESWDGMMTAVDILEREIKSGKEVLVWGDYDVDGITAASLVYEVLTFYNVPVRVHLPKRETEGYGLNIPELEHLALQGIGVLLTVDCGISDKDAVQRARELGFTVIISDHHQPPKKLPNAHALTNPQIGENPCSNLAGVGVIFFLMAALNTRLAASTGKRMDMRAVLDLVALGTLADMVPLKGQNRILAKNGLLKIAEASRTGISELKAVSGFARMAFLGAGQVVFNLAPRINAAGRLGHPVLAHDMLCTRSHEEAARLAHTLDELNTERRKEEERIFKEALTQAEQYSQHSALVLHGENWHQGVIGIVASRIVEIYYRPVFILCNDRDILRGSGRSVEEFDLHAGLLRCSDLLLKFGGHKQAAGIQLAPQNLKAFRENFTSVVQEILGKRELIPVLRVDTELNFTQATDFIILKSIELLQPFGIGNPEPVFISLPLIVRKRRIFGQLQEHVTLEVTEEASGITLQAKAWRQAHKIPESIQGKRIKMAYTPSINTYNGIASVELGVKDWDIL